MLTDHDITTLMLANARGVSVAQVLRDAEDYRRRYKAPVDTEDPNPTNDEERDREHGHEDDFDIEDER